MTRDELIRETSKRTGYTLAVCKEIIHETFAVMGDELIGHGDVKIPKFGTFYSSTIKERDIKMPDGKIVHKEASYMPKVKFSSVIKDGLKAK